jgi:predicted RNase H-like nuclease (RuvC/YqgF family)
MKKVTLKRTSPYIDDEYSTSKNNLLISQVPPAVNQHAEAIDELIKENKDLKERLATLEKIIEVLQHQINEIKEQQEESELIAQIQQPPKYSDK